MDIEKSIDGVAADVMAAQTAKKSKAGRKNRGITKRNRVEYIDTYAHDEKYFRHVAQPEDFNKDVIIETIEGEIITPDDLQNFRDCLVLTFSAIWEKFKSDNAELVKKHPYNFYKPLLLDIKRNIPAVGVDDIDKLNIIWDCLRDLLFVIGLYPTFETFSMLTNVYKYQLEKRRELSTKYSDFLQKIYIESKNALVGELSNNPYNQTNKIFLAKSVYGMTEQTETKHIEVNHNIRNLDNLPMFAADDRK